MFPDGYVHVCNECLGKRLEVDESWEVMDKSCQYVDMPITDVLQMIGRAGRPQYDDEAIACLFVKQDKKNFYKKFLYEPFPLESSLHKMLYGHINAEISSGMLTDKKQCVDYIKWTYFFKRSKSIK